MDRFDELRLELLRRCPKLEVRENEPMSTHTSFKIGGAVRLMAFPSTAEELGEVFSTANKLGVRTLVIGNGTNLLVEDKPLDIFAVKTCPGMSSVSVDGEEITAGAGILLSRLAMFAAENSLSGLEFAHGIPGSLGGAVSMNAGAYGGEIKDVVTRVVSVTPDGTFLERTGEECMFAYRHSVFSDTDEVVVSVTLRLAARCREDVLAKMEELAAKRKASQPLQYPSAGSTFKRPAGGYAAAMIDASGLKGFSVGGAQVSEKHAGFVINRGGASFDDVICVMEHIQKTVFEKMGTALEPEVKIIRR